MNTCWIPALWLACLPFAVLAEGARQELEAARDASGQLRYDLTPIHYIAEFTLVETEVDYLSVARSLDFPDLSEDPAYANFGRAVAKGEFELTHDGETLHLRKTTRERKHFDKEGNELPFDFVFTGERRYWFHPDGTTVYTESLVSADQAHPERGEPVRMLRKTNRDFRGSGWIVRAIPHQLHVALGWRDRSGPMDVDSFEPIKMEDGRAAWRTVSWLHDSIKATSDRIFDPESHLPSEVFTVTLNEEAGEELLRNRIEQDWSETGRGWFLTSYSSESDSRGETFSWTITEGPVFEGDQVTIPPLPHSVQFVDTTVEPTLRTGTPR